MLSDPKYIGIVYLFGLCVSIKKCTWILPRVDVPLLRCVGITCLGARHWTIVDPSVPQVSVGVSTEGFECIYGYVMISALSQIRSEIFNS